MPSLMIDLETMSCEPNAAILSIGACTFELTGENVLDTFGINISPESNQTAERHIDAATVQWWLQRPKEAQESLFSHQTNLAQALRRLRDFVSTRNVQTVWANDPDFDCVILLSACRAVKQSWPLHFSTHRSVRTIGGLAFEDPELRREVIADLRSRGTAHNAIDDAVAQARFVQLCFQMLQTGQAFREAP